MVTFQEAKLNAGLRQIYLDELVNAQFQVTGAPNYLGKVIYDHNKQELFNYAKSLFPDAQEGEIAIMLRTQGMGSDFNVFSRIDSYGDNIPRHVFVASQAFEVSEAEI